MTIYRVVQPANGSNVHDVSAYDVRRSERYSFDCNKIRLPAYVQIVVTKEIRELMHDARSAASTAFRELRALDDHVGLRFYRLCPTDPAPRFAGHCVSVDKVFNWRNEGQPGYANPLIKIPACMLSFHANEDAFNAYLAELEKMRTDWVTGVYSTWRTKAQMLVDKVFYSGLSIVEKRAVLMWWDGFMLEMRVWEDRFDKMIVPTFEEVVDELSKAIEDNVDLGTGYMFF